jgi:hypothetical protein
MGRAGAWATSKKTKAQVTDSSAVPYGPAPSIGTASPNGSGVIRIVVHVIIVFPAQSTTWHGCGKMTARLREPRARGRSLGTAQRRLACALLAAARQRRDTPEPQRYYEGITCCTRRGSSPSHCECWAVPSKIDVVLDNSNAPCDAPAPISPATPAPGCRSWDGRCAPR